RSGLTTPRGRAQETVAADSEAMPGLLPVRPESPSRQRLSARESTRLGEIAELAHELTDLCLALGLSKASVQRQGLGEVLLGLVVPLLGVVVDADAVVGEGQDVLVVGVRRDRPGRLVVAQRGLDAQLI